MNISSFLTRVFIVFQLIKYRTVTEMQSRSLCIYLFAFVMVVSTSLAYPIYESKSFCEPRWIYCDEVRHLYRYDNKSQHKNVAKFKYIHVEYPFFT